MALDFLDPDRLDVLLEDRETRAEERDKRRLLCAACGRAITGNEQRFSVSGSHVHRFTNPSGIECRIGCFREAAGCAQVSPATGAWTWFQGFRWRIAVCRECRIHLGWGYASSDGDRFFGLLLDRLVEPS